jgi:hypothetical protein
MSKNSDKDDVITFEDHMINPHAQALFIYSDERRLISVTDRAISIGCIVRHPVMIDYNLWKDYYREGDIVLDWLNKILNICMDFHNPGNNVIEFTFEFMWEPIKNSRLISCALTSDTLDQPYMLIKPDENGRLNVLH